MSSKHFTVLLSVVLFALCCFHFTSAFAAEQSSVESADPSESFATSTDLISNNSNPDEDERDDIPEVLSATDGDTDEESAPDSIVVTGALKILSQDDEIDQLDLTLAQLYYRTAENDENWDEAQIADINGGGRVDIEDLVLILNHIDWGDEDPSIASEPATPTDLLKE